MGRIGSTHGDRIDSTPAINAKNGLPTVIKRAPAPSADQTDFATSATMDARLVSPAERPASLSPLNTIKVDCIRAPNCFTRSFWLSKSITKYARSLNFGSDRSSPMIGACALQVGHHD